jgi:ribokinase
VGISESTVATTPEWDVVVVGGANTDYLARGSALPAPGSTADGDIFLEAPGGKGANQAVAAARLGARVALIARLGIDARGNDLHDALAAEGVDLRYVMRDDRSPTGAALIHVDQTGQKQILAVLGANRRLTPADVERASSVLRSTRVLLAQLEVPVETVSAAVRLARAGGARIVLDPAPAVPLADDLLQLVDVIKPNAQEAEVLTGIPVRNRESASRAARRLIERGVRAAAVQAGDEGDVLVWRDGESWLPRIRIDAVDATGAGDAFAATIASALAEGKPLIEAGRMASAAAALATTAIGAQAGLPRRDRLLAFISRGNMESRRESASTSQEATQGLMTEIENVTPGVGPSEPGTFRKDPE